MFSTHTFHFMFAGHQAVLCCCRERGVEVWDTMWSLWYAHNHASCHILQHKEKGRLAYREDAHEQFHGIGYARWHASEGKRNHHGGLQVWHKSCSNHDRHVGPRAGCSAGKYILFDFSALSLYVYKLHHAWPCIVSIFRSLLS
jgi:hypothetical protein